MFVLKTSLHFTFITISDFYCSLYYVILQFIMQLSFTNLVNIKCELKTIILLFIKKRWRVSAKIEFITRLGLKI